MPILTNIAIPPIVVDPSREPLERLASGRRLNTFDDDPAGFAIATGMDARARSRRVVGRNIRDAQAVLIRSDSALGLMTDRLKRMRELAIVALNGTTPRSYRLGQLLQEFWSARTDLNNIARRTEGANGDTLGRGYLLDVTVDDKGDPDSILTASIPAVWAGSITDGNGNTLNSAWLGTDTRIRTSLDIIDGGIDFINQVRTQVGAVLNRLDHAHEVNDSAYRNLEAARSGIEDADVGVESARLLQSFVQREGPLALGRLVRDLDENAVRQLLGT